MDIEGEKGRGGGEIEAHCVFGITYERQSPSFFFC